MSEAAKEVIPTEDDFMNEVLKSTGWNPVYRRQLEDMLATPALRCALKEMINMSDEQLKNIGMSDLTNEFTIKSALRAQGRADGFAQAVQLFCSFASTPEEKANG